MQKESLPIGTILDSGIRQYKIQSVLGKGGFGITYLATSTIYVDNIPVVAQFAIKEHYISSMNERQGTSVSISNVNNTEEIKESIDSFLVEAQRLNKLSLNHNGLVRVNESFRANGTAYYVMEYIKGQSLREHVKHSPQGKLREAEALQLFRPIAETIGYLHDNMVTHLDIKPDNILIRENGEPVVIDFGLSKHYSAKGTPTSTIKAAGCSAGYSPMEQYAGITTFSPEADIYALGATLLYMFTGKDPMISTEVKSGYVANVLSGLVSDSIVAAISHAMAKLSEERTHSISDLFSDLVGSGSEDIDEHVQPQTPHDNNKTKKKRPVTPSNSVEEGYAVKNPVEAIKIAFKRMFDFTGRSSRSEFWWCIPILVICWIACSLTINNIPLEVHNLIGYGNLPGEFTWNIIISLISLSLIFIMMGICTRRLHDVGYRDWIVIFPVSLFVYLTYCFLLTSSVWFSLSFYIILGLVVASFTVLFFCSKEKSQKESNNKIILSSYALNSFLIIALILVILAGIKYKNTQEYKEHEISSRLTEYNVCVKNCQLYLDSCYVEVGNDEKLDKLVNALDYYKKVVEMEEQLRKDNYASLDKSDSLRHFFPSTIKELTSGYINQAMLGEISDYTRVIGALQLAKEFSPSISINTLYESIIAETGYIKIKKIDFCNRSGNGDIIDDYGSPLYAKKMRYLAAKVEFDWFENYPAEVSVNVKILSPKGVLKEGESSPKGYTFSDYIRDYGNWVLLGWGRDDESTYEKGVWTYEIWHNNKKIYSTQVKLN